MSTSQLPCGHCSKTYESYKTAHGKVSKLCPQCRETQKRADEKRKDRIRNYQAEAKRNLEGTWVSFLAKSVERREKDNTLTKEQFLEAIQRPCFYCKYSNEAEINGLDRIDNTKGYSVENCVTACKTCNRMKHILHPVFFIEKTTLIFKHQSGILDSNERKEFYKKWNEYVHKSPVPYIYVKRVTEEKREIPYLITKEQYEELIYKPCYLCGFQCQAGNGLDRIDNTKREYSYENVKPCCSTCNMMKAFFTKEEFIQKIEAIVRHRQEVPIAWNEVARTGFHMGASKTETVTEVKEKQWRSKTLFKGIASDTLDDFYLQTIRDTTYTKETIDVILCDVKKMIKDGSTFETVETALKQIISKINYARNRK
jgi:hypothetical protein